MKQDNLRPVRIPAAEAQRLMPWELPMMDVGSVGEPFQTTSKSSRVTVSEEEIEPEKLTLADIEEIRENAAKEGFSQGHQEGFDQGYAEGKQQGYEQALKAGEDEVQQQLAILDQLCKSFSNPVAEQEHALEALLISLVQRFAKAVIDTEINSSPQPLLEAVKAALAELPSTVSSAEVHLHPDDLAYVASLPPQKGVEWVADPAVERGGCLIQSDNTQVDHSVASRFDQIVEQLSAALGKQSTSATE